MLQRGGGGGEGEGSGEEVVLLIIKGTLLFLKNRVFFF